YYTINLDAAISSLSLNDSIDLFEKEIARSIEYRLRADVKKGAALSGGLDSSFITAYASKLHSQIDNKHLEFTAISMGSIDGSNDESRYAKIVARSINVDHHLIFPKQEDFESLLNRIIYMHEEPFSGPSVF